MGSRGAFEQLEDRRLLAVDPSANGAAAQTAMFQSEYGQLPLSFEANQGQTDSRVDYLARGAGYTMFLTGDGAVLDLQQAASSPASGNASFRNPPCQISGTAIDMQFIGANPGATVTGLDKQQTTSNYFVGNDSRQWRSGIANYGQVEYQHLYSGIDAVFHGNQGQLEYDFNIAPGADPNQIQWQITGASGLSLDSSGNLLIHTTSSDLIEKAPNIYQEINGQRVAVSGHFVLEGADRVGFAIGGYDTSASLVIDPLLSYSTYLGGNFIDQATGIAVDAGDAYVTGFTASTNFPTTPGAYQTTSAGSSDIFIAKLNAAGSGLVYSTYLGGSSDELGSGIAVDGTGNAYVTGHTSSTNFPTTPGAYQTALAGSDDAFIAKLNAAGSGLLYSTYLGGTGTDEANGIAVDGAGNAYVTGRTNSANFPTTPGAYQTAIAGSNDAFITKMNAAGSGLLYSTYLGVTGDNQASSIAVDDTGNSYVTGYTTSANFPTSPGAFQTTLAGFQDAFVTKLNAAGSGLVYSTYLGGSGNSDRANEIALDTAGNAYIAGYTDSANFPTTPGAFQTTLAGSYDAFIVKMNAAGSGLVYSTYLGGSGSDFCTGIAVDGAGNSYVTGSTYSTTFPVTPGAYQTTLSGSPDAFMAKLNAAGSGLLYSTYLGGSGTDQALGIATDGAGDAYVAGYTNSINFPATPGAYQTTVAGGYDAFVAKFASTPPTVPVDSDPAPNVVLEKAPPGTYVGLTASSTDPEGGSITYSMTGDNSAGGFQIDSITGRVTVADGSKILYNANPSHSYQVTVQATASDTGLTASQTFTIAVVAPPTAPVDSDPAPNVVVEKAATGTYVGLTASSTDPMGGAIAYSLTSDSSGGGFQIDPVTGRVTVADGSKILYNASPSHSYEVTVQATGTDGLTASQTFTIAVTTHNQAFVNHVYLDVLARPADAGGLAYWTSQLDQGRPRGDVAFDLVHSNEYYANIIITPAYVNYLLRSPDAAGLAFWTDLMKNHGLTDERLEANFIASNEFYLVRGGGTNAGWVDALYMAFLGRPADDAGKAFWLQQLALGESRSDIAYGFASSIERERERITQDYQHYLGRTPDETGINYWLGQFQLGVTNEDIITGFVASDEYYAKHST